jgi:hypothetical protein
MLKPGKREPKKSYSSPIITKYGTVEEITQGKPSGAKADSGRIPANRTG